jgi:hypothetical protein
LSVERFLEMDQKSIRIREMRLGKKCEALVENLAVP